MVRISRNVVAFCVLALFILVLCQPAMAKNQVVKVAYADYSNYLYQDDNGQMQGYCADYLNLVAAQAQWDIQYIHLAWRDALTQLEQGVVDLVCSANYSAEREAHFSFSAFPVATEQYFLLTLPESDLYYEDFAALDGGKIATLEGTLTDEYLEEYTTEHGISCQTISYADNASLFSALRRADVDAMVVTNLMPHDGLRPIGNFAAVPVYFMSREGAPIMDQLNQAVSQIKSQNPSFDAHLQEEYYGQSVTALPALTRQEADYIRTHDTVNVGIYSGRGPFYMDEGMGLYEEILQQLSASSGMHFRPVVMEGSVADGLKSGKYDLIIDVTVSAEAPSDAKHQQSNPFFDVQTALLGRRGAMPATGAPMIIGITPQFATVAAALQQQYPYLTIHTYPDVRSCMNGVMSGEVDVMADSSYLLGYQLQNPRYSTLAVRTPKYLDNKACFLAPLDTPETLIRIVNQCLAQIGSTEIMRLTTYYTNLSNSEITLSDFLYSFRYSLWLVGALCGICLILGIVVWHYQRRNRRIANDRHMAQLANKAKSDFLSRMSHELRTPMNAIVGLAGLTLDLNNLPEPARENIAHIDASSQYLLGLLNDILDMSRIESAKMELSREIVSYEEFRTALFTIIAPQASRKGVLFTCTHNRPDCPYIYTDKMRLTQIFVNLLNNAVKFTPSGGEVELMIDLDIQDVSHVRKRFTVRDTGVGMSADFLERMFQPFEQERTEHSTMGTGLGLSIAKNLVELMGGTISVTSQMGKGTTVVVDFDFEIAPPPRMSSAQSASGLISSVLHRRHVLLVEDHPINQLVARKLLEKCGATVDTADDGKQALVEFLASGEDRYDCIFMDIQMPQMNGYECTRAIRDSGHLRAKNIPIVAMTANAFASDISMCLQSGMNGHIAKPITIVAIEAELARIGM